MVNFQIYYFCSTAVLYCTKGRFCFDVSNHLGLFIEIVKRPNAVNFKTYSDHVNAIYLLVLANRIARHNV
jgi:hypothetical protein